MFRVRDFMTDKVFTVRDDKKLLVSEEIMSWAHVRHVPVVDDEGKLVGMLSHRDVLRASVGVRPGDSESYVHKERLSRIDVREAMSRKVLTIGPDTSVQIAAFQMRQHGVGALPVVEGGRLVGILTEADLLSIVEHLSETGQYEPPTSAPAGGA